MDLSEFERRAAAVMPNMIVTDESGAPSLSPEFLALHDDVMEALGDNPEDSTLTQLAEALSGLRLTLSDPDIAAETLNALRNPPPPQPPLFDAIETGDVSQIRAALHGCDVNARFGEYDKTALYHAVTELDGLSLEVVHLLLDAGADPRLGLTDSNVLHGLGFARTRHLAPEDLAGFVTRCVDLGADLEHRTCRLQWTPLITAVSEWEPVATEALLMVGADITACAGDTGKGCFSGASVWDFANGHDETLAVLNTYAKRQ
ncbi:hypothetical protein [Marivita hallyeonensis]|uniref:Ankyrin repeat-containing protein n=1 Tax=Marivita hallyeonensis TaxID=996342 RepID=A0A1M5P7R1_9RHOB|nr:hypothetical protein [Marivita hallyeonensis]SHG97798.1 hypothetical protein SAMN05443551_1188 [Marivita hallyeonensis]